VFDESTGKKQTLIGGSGHGLPVHRIGVDDAHRADSVDSSGQIPKADYGRSARCDGQGNFG
jgi:hypothetical protein